MTIIACDCSIDVYCGPTVSSKEYRKARKEHECCECGCTIKNGEMYEYVTGLWDSEWSSFKTCIACTRIRNWYCGSGFEYGCLAEQIEYCLDFDYRKVPE